MNRVWLGTVLLSVIISFRLVFMTASMTFAGELDDMKAAIEPKGAVTCSYAVASSVTIPRAASSGSFTVTTGNNCRWSANTTSSWIKVTVPAASPGPGTVYYTVEKNSTGMSRTGTITINEDGVEKATFAITQNKKVKLKGKKQQKMPQVPELPE